MITHVNKRSESDEMAQGVKAFADQPDDPSFLSGNPMVEGMN